MLERVFKETNIRQSALAKNNFGKAEKALLGSHIVVARVER